MKSIYKNNKNVERAEVENKGFFTNIKKFFHRWFIDAFSGMAQGLFVTLIAGTIIKQLGTSILKIDSFFFQSIGNTLISVGYIASILMGAGIGAGIARYLKLNPLTILASTVAGMIGAYSMQILNGSFINYANFTISVQSPGNPIGAYVCSLVACELGNLVSGRTKLDIIIVPMTVIFSALLSIFIAWPFIKFIEIISKGIEIATTSSPFIMGIIISVTMGLLLTLPTSSAAIWISIASVSPSSDAILLAGGAACVGCCAHMIGFAVSSYRENRFGGFIAQGLGTSMLQIPNLMKNPKILLPQIISSAIVGPLATTVFKLRCTASGGGMGTSGLVGILGIIDATTGLVPNWQMWLGISLLTLVLPAVISLLSSEIFRKIGWIKFNDMKIDNL